MYAHNDTGRGLRLGVQTAGYTSLGMALALPEGGRIYACDISDEYPAVGRKLLPQRRIPSGIVYGPAYDQQFQFFYLARRSPWRSTCVAVHREAFLGSCWGGGQD